PGIVHRAAGEIWRDAGAPLANDDVYRQAATRGLFVLAAHVGTGLAHRLDDGVQRDMVLAVSEQGQPGSVDSLDGTHGVALDAGYLHQAANGVASKPQVVFHADSAAFSTWAGVPPSTAASPAAAIEHATPTSPWQPTSAPEIDAFFLYRK